MEVCLTFTDCLDKNDIEALVIATPAETHFTFAREALMAGKHVFVEKPLALVEEDGFELIELASKTNLPLWLAIFSATTRQ